MWPFRKRVSALGVAEYPWRNFYRTIRVPDMPNGIRPGFYTDIGLFREIERARKAEADTDTDRHRH